MDTQKLEDIFKLIDTDSSGDIEAKELIDFIKMFGKTMTEPERDLMMKMVGMAEVQTLNKDDFRKYMTNDILIGTSKEDALKFFKVFDEKNTGKISMETLNAKFSQFGETFKKPEDLLEVFKGNHLKNGDLHYKEWLEEIYSHY